MPLCWAVGRTSLKSVVVGKYTTDVGSHWEDFPLCSWIEWLEARMHFGDFGIKAFYIDGHFE